MGNAGIQMSWEGYTWILLRATGVSSQDLIHVLQPAQGQFPSTEPEFDAMCMTLRRMGHIRENAPNNLAQALRSTDRGNSNLPCRGLGAININSNNLQHPHRHTQHNPNGKSGVSNPRHKVGAKPENQRQTQIQTLSHHSVKKSITPHQKSPV